MFELLFGLLWTIFTAFFTFITYFANKDIASQEQFYGMIGPFLGIFWVIGIFMMLWGIKKILTNAKTEKYGEFCYGRIISIFESGAYVNNVPELKAHLSVYIESTGEVVSAEETIGLATDRKYNVGDYIEGKYYNGDINIASYVPEAIIPSHIQNRFRDLVTKEDTTSNVEYVKKDSLGDNHYNI